ncbi:hypothetical protein [uncultured Sphingomonas sp.]|uniref:hypothetical protein n=1 Tax=uncultured Sphingomonas sp. TaxID=158754 RepID=UPI0035CADA02
MKAWLGIAAALPVVASAAIPAVNTKWAYATSTMTIGLNAPFLERKLGPAKSKDDHSWKFEVGRCEVTYYIGRSGVIGFSFDLKSGCASKLNGFQDLRGLTLSSATTFANIEKLNLLHSHFVADCLEGCGNAADPVASFKAEGSRASGAYDISFDVPLAGDAALAAADTWTKAYRKKYGIPRGAYIPSEVPNCDFAFDDLVRPAFARVQVQSVTVGQVGYGYVPDCANLSRSIAEAKQ